MGRVENIVLGEKTGIEVPSSIGQNSSRRIVIASVINEEF